MSIRENIRLIARAPLLFEKLTLILSHKLYVCKFMNSFNCKTPICKFVQNPTMYSHNHTN